MHIEAYHIHPLLFKNAKALQPTSTKGYLIPMEYEYGTRASKGSE